MWAAHAVEAVFQREMDPVEQMQKNQWLRQIDFMKKKLRESNYTLNLNLFPKSISQYFDGFLIKYPKLGYSF